ncbi:MAG: hypothetical protein ACPIOQ_46225, partial [Promethearchaeia archaeon]
MLLLLEAGADPNATTPFSLERRTCAHGHHNNERRNGRRTPLHYTVKSFLMMSIFTVKQST